MVICIFGESFQFGTCAGYNFHHKLPWKSAGTYYVAFFYTLIFVPHEMYLLSTKYIIVNMHGLQYKVPFVSEDRKDVRLYLH